MSDEPAYVCEHVFAGGPILLVLRQPHDWQLLCGEEHVGRPHIVSSAAAFARDPTLQALHDLPAEWFAEREAVGAAWRRSDLREAAMRTDVEEQGFHLVSVESEPSYAYTVGLQQRFDHPELFMIGRPIPRLTALVDAAARYVVDGHVYRHGQRTEVEFRAMSPAHIARRCGHAVDFYAGAPVRMLQMVFPDRQQRFPWDDGADPDSARLQPVLDGS